MTLSGILTALLTTCCWILLQTGWMHIRPAKNRMGAMLAGYVLSIPFIYPAFRLIAHLLQATPEKTALGLVYAFGFSLLLFLGYVECFYHVERAVTIRLLIEIQRRSKTASCAMQDILAEYNINQMIHRRMEILRENNFIELTDNSWRLKPKGQLFCALMAFSCWVFQSKTQDERL